MKVLTRLFAAMTIVAVLTSTGSAAPRVLNDISYGSQTSQKMDVYIPEGPIITRPGVILIHGGGWEGGDKNFYSGMGPELAKRGFVAFSVNYRLSGIAHYPAQVDDVQSAIRYMRAHAATFHMDPTRVGALGDSAGGHLSLYVGTHDTRDNSELTLSGQSSRVQCVVDFYGPSDLTVGIGRTDLTDGQKAVDGILTRLFGTSRQSSKDLAHSASPLFAVDAKSAPTLIITGTDDNLVAVDQSTRMADALRAAGVETTLAIIYKEGHGFLDPGTANVYTSMSYDWLTRHLKP